MENRRTRRCGWLTLASGMHVEVSCHICIRETFTKPYINESHYCKFKVYRPRRDSR